MMRRTAATCLMLCWIVAPAKAQNPSAEIESADHCRNLINDLEDAADAASQTVVEMDLFKTILVDVWLECRDSRFEAASIKFGAAKDMFRPYAGE